LNAKQAFLMAIKSLKTSKMRSFLTMLGIIIGVASVIILVSLINGMSNEITQQFESMGTNLLSVNLMGRGSGSNRSAGIDTMEELVTENPEYLSAMSPTVSVGNATVKYDTYDLTASCTGVNEYYGSIRNYEVETGRFISYTDVENRRKVCILGTYEVQELFGNADPLGQEIKINGEVFTVIGVLPEKADSTESSNDDIILMPYTTAMRLGRSRVTSYVFSSATSDNVEQAKAVIENALYEIYQSDNSYMVMSQAEMLEQMDELTGTMALILVGIAGISLLVGGIGIMNIMLVTVTERIREIGIRKSLGARRRDILGQFLIESSTTSALGGVLGIILGIAAAYGMGALFDLSIAISASAIIIAFSVSVMIGIIFGYLPANKAAKLNPIDALRYE